MRAFDGSIVLTDNEAGARYPGGCVRLPRTVRFRSAGDAHAPCPVHGWGAYGTLRYGRIFAGHGLPAEREGRIALLINLFKGDER